MRCWYLSVHLLVALGAVASCNRSVPTAGRDDAGVERIVVAGSTALLPLLTEAANLFMRTHPRTAVVVEAGGSRIGIKRALDGSAAIGASDVYADPAVAPRLVDHQVAITGFAAMANRGSFNEHIESLTREQLRGIFTGTIRDWAEIGGEPQAITVINRGKNSGTRMTFGRIVLGGDRFASGPEQDSSALVLSSLEQTKGAICYLALSYGRASLKVFAVDHVAPTNENVANGSYPIWSYEHLYTLGPARGAAGQFIDFILSSEAQRVLVPKNGFTPIGSTRREAGEPR